MIRLLGVSVVILFVAGCQEDSIRAIKAPKPADPLTRMIAVLVPRSDATWFFKMTGPSLAVAGAEPSFQKYLELVKFSDGEAPVTWTLPDGWSKGPANRERFATLRTGLGVEVTVTFLGTEAKEVLPNVNRWRGQIGLPPTDAGELPKMTRAIRVGDTPAVWVDLISPGPAAISLTRTAREEVSKPTRLEFQTPTGWETLPGAPFRAASFRAGQGDDAVTVTVTPLDGSAGGTTANVNRWRTELGLAEQNEAEIKAATKELIVDGKPALYFDILGPEKPKRERTLAVIAERGRKTWFLKMRGAAETAARQQTAFEAFARSLRFPPTQGD